MCRIHSTKVGLKKKYDAGDVMSICLTLTSFEKTVTGKGVGRSYCQFNSHNAINTANALNTALPT